MTKDNAQYEYFSTIIEHSWTWARLTEEEKKRFFEVDFSRIKGTVNQRCKQAANLYMAFLLGLGYKPGGWRWE